MKSEVFFATPFITIKKNQKIKHPSKYFGIHFHSSMTDHQPDQNPAIIRNSGVFQLYPNEHPSLFYSVVMLSPFYETSAPH